MPTQRDVQINGETYKVVVETDHETESHGKVHACTAVHDQRFARRIGGVRFVEGETPVGRTELGELAEGMTWKSALAGIPADGEKSVVYCPKGLPQTAEMAEIMAAHLAELKVADPGVIFGPDIACGEAVMDLLAHTHGEGDHVSGLSKEKGGLSIDREGNTARGMDAALSIAAPRLKWDLHTMRAAVQGFGAVGAHFAKHLQGHGVIVNAVSTSHGALIATTPKGLDIDLLFNNWKNHGDEFFEQYKLNTPDGAHWYERDSLFKVEAEIFVPAARTDVLAMPGQPEIERKAWDVTQFANASGVKIVMEGANHPLTYEAESYLESLGVFIFTDYIVNCGGLIGCWADWAYRAELKGVNKRKWYTYLRDSTSDYTAKVVEENMRRVLDATGNSLKNIRDAGLERAKDLRKEFKSKYEAYRVDNPAEVDGRAFARLRMDAEFSEFGRKVPDA